MYDKSRPPFFAKKGFVGEVVRFADLRAYPMAFTGAACQNPKSIYGHHQMVLPRTIRG